MLPRQFTVTSANTPKTIPTNWRGGEISIIATPSGAGDYDVAFTTVPIQDTSITPNWIDITGMSAATTQQDASAKSITALRITLNSGTNVVVDISQSDV